MLRSPARIAVAGLLLALGGGWTVTDTARAGEARPVHPRALPADTGFYSAVQADRGRETFLSVCEECHSISEFRGRDFEWTWRRQTAWNLFVEISWNMPEDDPASLPEQTYADVVAYILQVNGYAQGDADLLPAEAAMREIPLGPGAAKARSRDDELP